MTVKEKSDINPVVAGHISAAWNYGTRAMFETIAQQCEHFAVSFKYYGDSTHNWNLLAYHVRVACDKFLGEPEYAPTSALLNKEDE